MCWNVETGWTKTNKYVRGTKYGKIILYELLKLFMSHINFEIPIFYNFYTNNLR